MNLSQLGLLLNIIGTIILAFESWVRLRTIRPDATVIGYGQIGIFWRGLFRLGWPLVIAGFVLQYIGGSSSGG